MPPHTYAQPLLGPDSERFHRAPRPSEALRGRDPRYRPTSKAGQNNNLRGDVVDRKLATFPVGSATGRIPDAKPTPGRMGSWNRSRPGSTDLQQRSQRASSPRGLDYATARMVLSSPERPTQRLATPALAQAQGRRSAPSLGDASDRAPTLSQKARSILGAILASER